MTLRKLIQELEHIAMVCEPDGAPDWPVRVRGVDGKWHSLHIVETTNEDVVYLK